MRKRKSEQASREKEPESYRKSRREDNTNEEHGTAVLLATKTSSQGEYSSLAEHHRQLEQSERSVTMDHLLRSSLDLDDAAKKHIEQILAIGSKRFARELVELLESASRCVEQNANLLKILRHHLNLSPDSPPSKESSERR